MRLSIRHDTTYDYADEVRGSIQYLRLTPQESARQHVLNWQLDLPGAVQAQRDPYGNILHVLTMEQPHESIVIGARGVGALDLVDDALRGVRPRHHVRGEDPDRSGVGGSGIGDRHLRACEGPEGPYPVGDHDGARENGEDPPPLPERDR